jgi:D-serine deaminase-like pyridoxal phosphate-dependent protein
VVPSLLRAPHRRRNRMSEQALSTSDGFDPPVNAIKPRESVFHDPAFLERLRTPCLVVDGATVDENCNLAEAQARRMNLTVRPHAKAHKCSTLLRAQLELEHSKGITCATVHEAAALAGRGFDDILIANELVSPATSDVLLIAAEATAELTVVVDSEPGIAYAEAVARRAGREIRVLVDLDVGSGRCGVAPDGSDVLRLTRIVAASRWLQFDGLMGYTGRGNYLPSATERRAVAETVRRQILTARASVEADGFAVRTISGGSTGLFDMDQGLTEMQLGTYVLMEGRYADVGLPFQPAVFCAATVISSSRDGHAVLDCGWKAMSGEFGLPLAPPGITPIKMSDEHLICEVDRSLKIAVGDVVLVIPSHLDPTINLHERLVVVHGDKVDEWPVDLRRTGRVVVAAPDRS